MLTTKTYLKNLSYHINGAAIEVHKTIGPGLLESVYHKFMKAELIARNISFVSEPKVPLSFKGVQIETSLRADLFIENLIVVELKSQDAFLPIHKAQLLTYMKFLKAPKGILYNFNVVNIYKQGQISMVNELFKKLPEQ